jgi:hypothetical protein
MVGESSIGSIQPPNRGTLTSYPEEHFDPVAGNRCPLARDGLRSNQGGKCRYAIFPAFRHRTERTDRLVTGSHPRAVDEGACMPIQHIAGLIHPHGANR